MLLAGCTQGNVAKLTPLPLTAPVGPNPRVERGLLIVYSATEQWSESFSGDETYCPMGFTSSGPCPERREC